MKSIFGAMGIHSALTALTALTAWAAFTIGGTPGVVANDSPVEVSASIYRAHCEMNMLEPRHDGLAVAVFRRARQEVAPRRYRDPVGFVVLSLPTTGVGGGGRASVHTFTAGANTLRPVGWDGGTLLFRKGSSILVTADNSTEWELSTTLLDEEWRDFEFRSINSVSVKQFTDPTVLNIVSLLNQDSDLRRRTIYFGDRPHFSAVSMKTGQIFMHGSAPGDLRKIGPATFLWDVKVGADEEGPRIAYLGGPDTLDLDARVQPYSRVYKEASTGAIVGRFSSSEIFEGNRHYPFKIQNGEIVDVVQTGSEKLVLTKEAGRNFVYRITNNESRKIERHLVCDDTRTSSSLIGTSRVAEEASAGELIQFDDRFETVGLLYRGGGAPTRRVVVYFHGGPGDSLAGSPLPKTMKKVRAAGYDVLAIEYSGSVGAGLGLSLGLANKADFGFKEDTQAIRGWLESRRYEEINLYAESFGAVPAMYFADAMSGKINRTAFLAPLLKIPEPESTEGSSEKVFSVEARSQFSFELGLFGSVERRMEFGTWLWALSDGLDVTRDDLFVFGEYDKRTPVTSLSARMTEEASIVVVPKATHITVGAKDNTRNLIAKHLTGAR